VTWAAPPDREDFGYLQLWDAVAGAIPDRECIVQGEFRQTWQQTRDRSQRLGWWLTEQGFGYRGTDVAPWESPNDLVGILMRNRPEFLEAVLGAYRARCAPFNINYRYQAAELAYLLDDAKPSALVFEAEYAAVVQAALEIAAAPAPRLIMVAAESGAADPDKYADYESVLAAARPPDRPVISSPDDVHVLYTGGTTGLPKGVMWQQRELAGGATGTTVPSLAEAAASAPRRTWLRAFPAPPLMHGAALWFAFNAWSRGGTLVLSTRTDHFDAPEAVDLCRTERVAWMAMIGDVFAQPFIAALEAADAVPPDLAYVFSSGAALSERSWAGLRGFYPKLAIINALGSSETGPQAFQTESGESRFSAGPNTVVVSEDYTRILSADEPGTGWLSNSGTLPRGYMGDEERTTATFRIVSGRRLAVSGDRASIDSSGEISFLGRDSNVINTGGEKVYAEEVERALKSLPAVADALVLGRDSPTWGQEVVALVVDAPGHAATTDELREGCRAALAGYKLPKAVFKVGKIERSPSGKADYAWARATVQSAGQAA
jgi:acyl-CoA synthetase (AMP-forming)/AMP-acid ligase II